MFLLAVNVKVFSSDYTQFTNSHAVILLQVLNLVQALKDDRSPVQLVQTPAVIVERKYGRAKGAWEATHFTQSFQQSAPFFSWC